MATPDRIEKTYHSCLECARPPQEVWRDAKVPRKRFAERARSPKPVFESHSLNRVGTLFEVMHREEQPAPGDAAPGRGKTGAPEPIFERSPPDPACGCDLLHAKRLFGMLEAVAEDWQQRRGHFQAHHLKDPLGDFGTHSR